MIELNDTDASQIAGAFVKDRRRAGSPAMGMVMTLIVVVDAGGAEAALKAAQKATRAHPSRVLAVVLDSARGKSRIDAQVGVGRAWGGEAAMIALQGPVVKHAASVVLPLLLPDSPVVVWWATDAPAHPSADPLGALATRRITDLGIEAPASNRALHRLCEVYEPGDTDLSWTRLTLWRAILAAALDQQPGKVTAASITAERHHPSAALLRAWLGECLRVDVAAVPGDGPAITEVRLETRAGPIVISRPDGTNATLTTPGLPDRTVALRIRDLHDLLAEELRHLDADEVYAAVLERVLHDRGAR